MFSSASEWMPNGVGEYEDREEEWDQGQEEASNKKMEECVLQTDE